MFIVLINELNNQFVKVDLLENPHSDGCTHDVIRVHLDWDGKLECGYNVSWDVESFFLEIEVPRRIKLPETAVIYEPNVVPSMEELKRTLQGYAYTVAEKRQTIEDLEMDIREYAEAQPPI